MAKHLRLAKCLVVLWLVPVFVVAAEPAPKGAERPVSYFKEIRPIFQAQCQGCHQPAKAGGDYIMTDFAKLLAGGETGEKAILPGKPSESNLFQMITPEKGEAAMPKEKSPLSAAELALVRKWIEQGAKDDTPENARVRFDAEHPPVYSAPMVVTSLDYSPDGELLAVPGYFEVLLHKGDGSGLAGRLVGRSPRIEAVRFSPDGKRLAVSGGTPGQMGEVQVWDVANRKLLLSHNVTYDTLHGVSWSSDGKLIAFGGADRSVRVIDAATGKQVLYQNTHEDRVLETTFSFDDSHVISVSGDRTAKLTELATQRFIDNITSITPGALKGGINAVARHPSTDVILVGGADGEPKLYLTYRRTKRVIGDDANLIRKFPALEGRVNDVAISRDGRIAAAVSSLDGRGYLRTYALEADQELPAEIKQIVAKRTANQTPEERKKLEDYHSRGVQALAAGEVPTNLYAVVIHPRGDRVVMAGSDGTVRFVDSKSAKIVKEFIPVPLSTAAQQQLVKGPYVPVPRPTVTPEKETLAKGDEVRSLTVEPTEIKFHWPYDSVQFVLTAQLASGELRDVTRMVTVSGQGNLIAVSPLGLGTSLKEGRAELTFQLGGTSAKATVDVAGLAGPFQPDYVRDVAPVISKMGCNQGTCHGANKGKGGFKLSLRGNDPVFDVRALTDEIACRRVNLAAADQSLIMQKASANLPHEGGRVYAPGEANYEIVRTWISQGAKLNTSTPRVAKIEVFPKNPIVYQPGSRQQFRVMARYADGTSRDVTAEAWIDSGNIEVAKSDVRGLVTTYRRGEAPILARFEGNYAVSTLFCMGDRTGFVWKDFPSHNFIDDLTQAKWKRTKTQPSELVGDAAFLRRIYIDLIGIPPTVDEVRQFLADGRPTRVKREELIDALVGSPDYVEHWTNKWADLLQVNRKYLGVEGATAFRDWIRQHVGANVPYNVFAHRILTASGSNRLHPEAAFYKIHRTPEETMETTTHLFLGLRFNCNKCHDHPFERWTQDQYFQTAAYFAQFGLKPDPASKDRRIEGTAVEAATALFEEVYDRKDGEVKHERTGKVTPPKFPYVAKVAATTETRREQLADWTTATDNPYFARNFANRLWAYLMGVGLIEPIDDIRASNPPTNPELLDRLTQEFVKSGFDVQHLVKLICKSRTYQLDVASNKYNEDDKIDYSHATAKRLPAEVMFDALQRVTGSTPNIPGVSPGTRAAQFLDSAVGPASGFLTQFGRPPRESACECERSTGVQFGPVMALVSGETVGNAISDPKNAISDLVARNEDNRQLVSELYLRILNRRPTEQEVQACLQDLTRIPEDHQRLLQDLAEAEKKAAPLLAEKEQKRREAIQQAEGALAAYKQQVAARDAELDRQQQARTRELEQKLNQYLATLPEKVRDWDRRGHAATEWTVLDFESLNATNGARLTKESDGSVFATRGNNRGTFRLTARTKLEGITAIRLEAMPDPRLPNRGPGRAPDGNFVLSEFEVDAASLADPTKLVPVKLNHAKADFNQGGYHVLSAINGTRNPQDDGWAIAGEFSKRHVAEFEFETPVGDARGTLLTIELHHLFVSGEFSLGRFRLSVTNSKDPVMLGLLPQPVEMALLKSPQARTEGDKKLILEFYRAEDKQVQIMEREIAASKQPRPADPQLVKLQEALVRAQAPVQIDLKLKQLRDDAAVSTQQLLNPRLMAAQDIAWALINSPEFLFNH